MILLILPPKRATIYLNKKLHTKERGILEHFEVYCIYRVLADTDT